MKRSEIVSTINSLKGETGHKKVLDVYNSQCPLPRGYKVKQTDAWCATTVSAVFIMNGYDDIAECSCPQMIEKAKKLGIWVEDDAFVPQIGDIIMYDWQDTGKGDDVGVADHVGIVVSVSKSKIVVREGNKNKSIGNRDVTVNGLYIRGYITPPYEAEKATKKKKTTNTSAKEKKSQETQDSYVIGKTYTVYVNTSLNVRTGAGTNYKTVGYKNLTANAKQHANSLGALLNGTKVTCQQIKVIGNQTWMKIPSGWICAKSGSKVYVK